MTRQSSTANSEDQTSMSADLRELVSHLSVRRRHQFALLVMLMLLGALAEMATLATVLSFLSVMSEPSANVNNLPQQLALTVFGVGKPENTLTSMFILFVTVLLLTSFVRLCLIWTTALFVQKLGHDLIHEVFARILDQPYDYHVTNNSSESIAAISKVQMLVGGTLMPLLQTLSGLMISTLIIATLIAIAPVVSLSAALIFTVSYVSVSLVCGKWLRRNGSIIARAEGARVQVLQESLGGIRDVILDRTQRVFVDRFSEVDLKSREARAANAIIGQSPRHFIEAIGMIMIAVFAMVLSSSSGGLAAALPSLGALALGAQRMLPLVNQVYVGWTNFVINRQVTANILEILRLPVRPPVETCAREPIEFRRSIALDNVSFAYGKGEIPVLERVNLEIEKGAVIGFVGKTGAGKSTISDLIMGLIVPTRGRVSVDGVPLTPDNLDGWQAHVAHVPQAIYLSDATIAQNIAFGIAPEHIDNARVVRVAGQARLADFIDTLPDGYETFVGERGVRLSGGQRQRIGLARALYKNAQLLVLDEATSALDSETEQEVMTAIENMGDDYTIVIVAHRLSTLKLCDVVYRVEDGALKEDELSFAPEAG